LSSAGKKKARFYTCWNLRFLRSLRTSRHLKQTSCRFHETHLYRDTHSTGRCDTHIPRHWQVKNMNGGRPHAVKCFLCPPARWLAR